MLLEDEYVSITPSRTTVKHYRNLGYDAHYQQPLLVKSTDLTHGSNYIVTTICDRCGEQEKRPIIEYYRVQKRDGNFYCRTCARKVGGQKCSETWANRSEEERKQHGEKIVSTNLERYGCRSTAQVPEIKERQIQTLVLNYGVSSPLKNKDLQEKARLTNLERRGVEYPLMSKEVQEKSQQTNLRKRGVRFAAQAPDVKEKIKQTNLTVYGTTMPLQNPEVRAKAAKTLYEKGNISTSKQQVYLHDLYGGTLNGVVKYYNCDIVFEDKKIICEYNGSGHDLKVKLGGLTQEEFNQREIKRFYVIKREEYRQMNIISRDDLLPEDDVLLKMLSVSMEYFDKTDHTWISWDIDKGLYFNFLNKDGVLFDYGPLRHLKNECVMIGGGNIATEKNEVAGFCEGNLSTA